ncbi:MAG: carbonic anhydrase [Planctomycetota bacterium]|jgi:carbonic anhydrase
MSFCTVVNCMDGRIQLPVIEYLQGRFGVKYVDNVTEPGPVLIMSRQTGSSLFDSILNRVRISVEKHGSMAIAVVAHHDCAGNPVNKDQQITQIGMSIGTLKQHFKDLEIVGLWVGGDWRVEEVREDQA